MENSSVKESQTFEQSLYKLYKDGKITLDEAMLNADSPTNLHWLVSHGQSAEEDEAELQRSQPLRSPAKGRTKVTSISHSSRSDRHHLLQNYRRNTCRQ